MQEIVAIVKAVIDVVSQIKGLFQGSSDTSEIDLQVLKELWPYIDTNQVDILYEGVIRGFLVEEYDEVSDSYLDLREQQYYKLYDKQLEQLVEKYDNALTAVLSSIALLFEPIRNENIVKFIPMQDDPLESERYKALRVNAEALVEQKKKLIEGLKRKRILHLLVQASREKMKEEGQ